MMRKNLGIHKQMRHKVRHCLEQLFYLPYFITNEQLKFSQLHHALLIKKYS